MMWLALCVFWSDLVSFCGFDGLRVGCGVVTVMGALGMAAVWCLLLTIWRLGRFDYGAYPNRWRGCIALAVFCPALAVGQALVAVIKILLCRLMNL
jgi:hypothetical protein